MNIAAGNNLKVEMARIKLKAETTKMEIYHEELLKVFNHPSFKEDVKGRVDEFNRAAKTSV